MLSLEGHELGGCKLIRKLGEGGMGVVYLGEELDAGNRLVALKIMRAGDASFASAESRDIVRHFQQEAGLLRTLSHPNILPVYGSGVDGDYLYIVMLYAQEGSLSDAIHGRARLKLGLPVALDRAVDILSQVASALQYCHDRGIVHRDVKPANVLIRIEPGGHWRMLLADFGVARPQRGGTARTAITGTFAYMAPEQFTGEFSPISDQYALAVMAYQLLTGRVPFEGDLLAISRAHATQEPPPMGAFNPNVPPAVEAVIRHALAKDPAQRYSSVAVFAEALRAVASGVPYEASPEAMGAPVAVASRGAAAAGAGPASGVRSGPPANGRARGQRGPAWPTALPGEGGTPPSRRRGVGAILVAGLALVLLAVGLLAAPGLLNAHAQQLHAQQTAVAQTAAASSNPGATPSTTTSATQTAAAAATGTASATQVVSPTATTQPTATPNLTIPTATASASVGTDIGSPPPAPDGVGAAVFSDPAPTCDSPLGPSWSPVNHPRTTCDDTNAVTLSPQTGGQLACIQQRVISPNDGYVSVLTTSSAQDVTLSFRQAQVASGQAPVSGYYYTVQPSSNSYTLRADNGSGTTKALASGTLPANLAAHFALGAKYKGSTITLYINGVQIDQKTDSAYSGGSMGLCSQSSATFKDAQVYALSS